MRSPTTPPQRPDRFFSVAEAAKILKVSEVTIYRGIGTGEFPAIKIRGRYVVPAKALDQLESEALANWAAAAPGADPAWGVA